MAALRARPVPSRSAPSKSSSLPTSRNPSSITREPAHLPLHRRLLYPYDHLEKPIPLLVPGDSPELILINERLHHLIALTLRAYILSWYPRFTRDRSLLPHIHQTIIRPILCPILNGIHDHPKRLTEFLLLDLPTILTLHIETYRSARAAVASGVVGRGEERLAEEKGVGKAYHARLPLLSVEMDPSNSASGEIAEYSLSPLYLTSLTDAMLRLYLPPAEYAADVERLMAREVIGRSVLASVGKKVGADWFWWSMGLRLLGESTLPAPQREERDIAEMVTRLFMKLWTTVILLWTTGASVMATLSAAPPAQDKYRGIADPWMKLYRAVLGVDGRAGLERPLWRKRLVWGVVEMIIALFGSVLDRLVPHIIDTRVLTPRTGLKLIDMLEYILFPLDGYPGVSPPDPTPNEAKELRERLEVRLDQVIPPVASTVFFQSKRDITGLLDPLGHAGCNAHLVGMMLDAAVAAVVPDLVLDRETTGKDGTENTLASLHTATIALGQPDLDPGY